MLTVATIRKWYKDCVSDRKFNRKAFETKLRRHGFRFTGSGAYKRVFVSRKYCFVVKTGEIMRNELKPHKNYLCPVWGNTNVLVQHKVEMKHSNQAYAVLKKKSPRWYDDHDSNCGFYKGKPVIIDL